MVTGRIDENLEARITIQVVGEDRTENVEFLVDTGFNGYLAVSPSQVTRFQLRSKAVQRGVTADGRIGFFDTIEMQIVWLGRTLRLRAQVLDEPLIGVRLLAGNELFVDWSEGGEVRLSKSK